MAKIKDKGGQAESPEDIWMNLKYLATSYKSYGEEKLIMPLQIKKILAYILDPEYRIEYNVNKTEKECVVTASFFWGGTDIAAGQGFVKRYINQIFPMDNMSPEERESIFESTVRGLAAARAITDAGIAMEFYTDLLETLDPEMSDVKEDKGNNSGSPAGQKVPAIPSNNKKKEDAIKAKIQRENSKVAADTSEETETTQGYDVPNGDVTVSMAPENKETMNGSGSLLSSPATENEKISGDQIEWAKNVVADIGKFKGHTLQKLIDCGKVSAIVWLVNNANGDTAKAADILMRTDPKFAYINNV